ncbi:MAG: MFS transporter [Cyclobacteriaceae bacterium]|nr:MFS transporter [Cyclobacteriaceae bacterium]
MKGRNLIVGLIMLIFFVISLLTNILGPIIPAIIDSFSLSLGLAGFLPFSFFVAYGVMSIPSGFLVEKYTEKNVLMWAFGLAFLGALTFALAPIFSVALFSLFLIGCGMAMLQVAINPLLRQAGGEAHFAFNSVMAQLAFGGASFLSPMLYSYLVQNVHQQKSGFIINIFEQLVPQNLSWVSLYWVFALISIVIILIIKAVKFPKVELKEEEKMESGQALIGLLKNKYVILFFFGIFAYVGMEQGIANWMSKFLQEYHHLNPEIEGANAISKFWGLLTIGCLLGLALLKFIDSKKVLLFFSTGAVFTLTAALFGSMQVALIAFPLTGFFLSVMWSVIFSLALNSVKSHHGAFSGILCTGIIGGAIVPLLVGWLGQFAGLRFGMLTLYIPLAYILSIGIWAKPLVANKTIKFSLAGLA